MDTSTAGSPTVVPSEWGLDSRRNSKSYETSPSSEPSEHGGPPPDQSQPKRLEGWPLLAELMAVTPGFEAFPRFESLNVKNLLYYQVELKILENSLRDLELGDIINDPKLHTTPENLIDSESPQWMEVQRLRVCLREYNEALLQYAQVSALAHPTTHNMNELVKWMFDGGLGNRKIHGIAMEEWGRYEEQETLKEASVVWLVIRPLTKPFTNLYNKIFRQCSYKGPYVGNLVAPRGRKSTDGLSRWIVEDLVPSWNAICKRWAKWHKGPVTTSVLEQMSRQGQDEKRRKDKVKKEKEIEMYKDIDPRLVRFVTSLSLGDGQVESIDFTDKHGLQGDKKIQTLHESTILTITSAISTLTACMIPVVAVFLLSIVEDLFHKLAMIACFTFLFGLSLMIVSEVNRVQVFMATSAFLAVLVVFIPVGGGN